MMAAPDPVGPKVVFVNRYFYPDQSASSQLLTDLAVALARYGFDVHVICSRQRYEDPAARLAPTERYFGVNVHRVWTSRFGRGRLFRRALDYATFYASSAALMVRLLTRDVVVVAKTDPPLISIVALVVAKLTGAHLVNWVQDVFPEVATKLAANPLPRKLDALLRGCRNVSLRAARTNVVLGARMSQYLLAQGISADKIAIVENWADVGPDPPQPVTESVLRSKLALSGKFVVGYSGNLGRAHEFQTLLRAATILRSDDQIVFLMIGGGVGMAQLAASVARLDLKNFRFLPYQPRDRVSDALAAADVHWASLLPALEGLIVPSKFYGILAAQRPVIFIGDADGELARNIQDIRCGATVAIGQIGELARLLTEWKSDAVNRERMGLNGYQAYCARYSAQRAIDRWILILKSSTRAG